MKKPFLNLLLLLISSISFAQGISIQGIARDNESSAITDTSLTFTFSITQDDNTVLYAETQSIRTDNYGVFSHIVSTGNSLTVTFNNVDFSIQNLKLKVSVNYNGNTIEVYNQAFQYTPYAHFAKNAHFAKKAGNGVPTGSIMPYAGADAPEGWVLCNGESLTTISGSANLRDLLNSDNAPNLKGLFLRGTGISAISPTNFGPDLRRYQGDSDISHRHSNNLTGTTTSSGIHIHTMTAVTSLTGNGVENTNGGDGQANSVTQTNNDGDHKHDVAVSGNSGFSDGTSESRPVNYGVNYIIKL